MSDIGFQLRSVFDDDDDDDDDDNDTGQTTKDRLFRGNSNSATGALMFACNKWDETLVRALLCEGADLTRKHKGYTALQLVRRLMSYCNSQLGAYESLARILDILEATHDARLLVFTLNEWRPQYHAQYPQQYRAAMRTLLMLAKTYVSSSCVASRQISKELVPRFPQTCLALLPEELLQYIYALITTAPIVNSWIVPRGAYASV